MVAVVWLPLVACGLFAVAAWLPMVAERWLPHGCRRSRAIDGIIAPCWAVGLGSIPEAPQGSPKARD